MRRTVGFVDYYLNEWHANNYVGWIKDAPNFDTASKIFGIAKSY